MEKGQGRRPRDQDRQKATTSILSSTTTTSLPFPSSTPSIPMESLRHHRSPGSDRFLAHFSPSPPDASSAVELHESDILWTSASDVPEQAPSPPAMANPCPTPSRSTSSRALLRRSPDRGLLAALPDIDRGGFSSALLPPIILRKPSITSVSSSASDSRSPVSASRMIPAIPKPKTESAQSMPMGRMHRAQSLPINVPVVSRRMRRLGVEETLGANDLYGDDHEMMPPHEIVARSNGRRLETTFSMLQGSGRTLKGRDLRRVRDAVFRQTGFLD